MPTFAEWTQVATAAFTAGTAFYAARTVRHGERLWRSSIEPDLHPQVLLNVQTNTTDLVLVNLGGLAKGVNFYVQAGGQQAGGIVHDGFLPARGKVFIHCALPQSLDAECVVQYRGPDEASYFTARVGGRHRLRPAPRRGEGVRVTSLEQAWARAYPDRDWCGMNLQKHQVGPIEII